MRTIFLGGHILTMNETEAEAVLVEDGKRSVIPYGEYRACRIQILQS